ncbi:MAG: diguanylate cyclase [Burkholderiaceae bacterium]|nr:diguanylate cyclase [Burkholderiaceae bacterium]
MNAVRIPNTEPLRIAALRRECLPGSEADPALDALTRAATLACGTPIAMFSLVDDDRQWAHCVRGLPAGTSTPRSQAFCAQAILSPSALLQVHDARLDARFSSNPLVTGPAGVRFYAGMPVRAGDGQPIGTLCVLDHEPRRLDDAQRAALRELAHAIEALLRMRQRCDDLSGQLGEFRAGVPAAVCVLDANGRITEVSDDFVEQYGHTRASALGRNLRAFMPPPAAERFGRLRETFWLNGGCRRFDTLILNADGESVDVTMSARARRDERQRLQEVVCVLVDVSRQRGLERELELKAGVDALTGVCARAPFIERLADEATLALRRRRPLSLVLVDVDGLRHLNDRCGLAAGDTVLRTLAAEIGAVMNPGSLLGRIGADQFGLLLPQTRATGALHLAERIRVRMQSLTPSTMGIDAPAAIRVGIATLSPEMVAESAPDALLAHAHSALDVARDSGGNRCVVADEACTSSPPRPGSRATLANACDLIV